MGWPVVHWIATEHAHPGTKFASSQGNHMLADMSSNLFPMLR